MSRSSQSSMTSLLSLTSTSSTPTSSLKTWGFPDNIVNYYKKKNIEHFFNWQIECLQLPGVFNDGKNLVYSAPTSAGKSMVADVLLFKTLIEQQKKVIVILPFVSIAIEKVESLKSVCRRMGFRIDSFAGNVNSRGGLKRVDVAVCTIEKANNMVNRLIEDGQIDQIGLIIVDELHMVGDSKRGYLIELLLSKLLHLKNVSSGIKKLQIVGMSATIPNLSDLAQWLDARLYVTDFRPVPLKEHLVNEDQVSEIRYGDQKDCSQKIDFFLKRTIDTKDFSLKSKANPSLVLLAIETVVEGFSSLIFCPIKALCEKLSQEIVTDIVELGMGKKPKNDQTHLLMEGLKRELNFKKIEALIDMLKKSPTGIDPTIERRIRFGVGYHHSGLTLEERSAIEQGFRDGTIRILCSTTTLSAGVNLPARRVMITSPFDYKNQVLDVSVYRQMIGRAGRKGIDILGESYLFCQNKEAASIAKKLFASNLRPIQSNLIEFTFVSSDNSSVDSPNTPTDANETTKINDNLAKAILEVIVTGLAVDIEQISSYLRSTFSFNCSSLSTNSDGKISSLEYKIHQVIQWLINNNYIYINTDASQESSNKNATIVVTNLARAVVASGVSPSMGNLIKKELERCLQGVCLLNDLHLVYEVTPLYVADQLTNIDWNNYLNMFNKFDSATKLVAQLVGADEGFIISMISGFSGNSKKLSIHRRFYASLALYDLIQEVSILKVVKDYRLTKGLIQTLQQQASSFAGMLSTYCNRMGWSLLETLIDQLAFRLTFGVQRELIDLIRLPCLNSTIARQLFKKGYDSIVSLIYCKPVEIESILVSTLNLINVNSDEDLQSLTIYIANLEKHFTVRDLARMILIEARSLVETDIGQKLQFVDENFDLDNENRSSNSSSLVTFKHQEAMVKNQIKPTLLANQSGSKKQAKSQTPPSAIVRSSTPNKKNEKKSLTLIRDDEDNNYSMLSIDDSLLNELPFSPLAKNQAESVTANNCKISPAKRKPITSLVKDSLSTIDMSVDSSDSLSITKENLKSYPLKKVKHNSVSSSLMFDKEIEEEELLNLIDSNPNIEVDFNQNIQLEKFKLDNENQQISFLSSSSSSSMKFEEKMERFFQMFRKNSRFNQENFLPSFYEKNSDFKNFHLVHVNSVEECQNLFEHLFSIDSDQSNKSQSKRTLSIPTISIHLEWTENKKQGRFCKVENKEFCPTLPISKINLTKIFFSKFNDHRVFLVKKQEALNHLKSNWFKILSSRLIEFNQVEDQPGYQFVCYDAKKTICCLYEAFQFDRNFLIQKIEWFDLVSALWLLDPESPPFNVNHKTIKDLAILSINLQLDVAFFQKVLQFFTMSATKEKNLNEQMLKTKILFNIVFGCLVKLRERNLYRSYRLIEIPCRLTLFILQTNPITVDIDELKRIEDRVIMLMENLQTKIFRENGRPFNLASPQQVSTVIYSKCLITDYFEVQSSSNKQPLAISPGKKHLSTSKLALMKLQSSCGENFRLPTMIIEWRRLNHVLTNGIRPLRSNWHKNNDKAWIYCQCDEWTSTGRIAMYEPQLINLNKNFELTTVEELTLSQPATSKNEICLRRLICAKNGCCLVTSDYCQLELRILAHLSMDQNLLNTLNDTENDVFKSIASKWKKVPIEQVDYETRQLAKQICYGIIYGMGDELLASKLEITAKNAVKYKSSFFKQYPRLEAFIESTVNGCRKNGYVETIAGRRRPLPHVNSSDLRLQQKSFRQAVNTRIQGSAADILKISMVAVQKALEHVQYEAKLILQMHDELMYEVDLSQRNSFGLLLKQQMEKVSKYLQVILPVKLHYGQNWSDVVEFQCDDLL